MADISKITVPSGASYDVKDAEARTAIEGLAPKASPEFTGSISLGRKADTTIGENSVATGTTVTASGTNSFAEGGGTTASGGQAHAEGGGSTASGNNSHAEGGGSTASGQNSHAEGGGTTASAYGAHAEGGSSNASGNNSHAEGSGTRASGANSHAEGGSSLASAQNAHAEGGATTASHSGAHAEGASSLACGSPSHAEGAGTIASGSCAHAEGLSSVASGTNSHAEGYNTIAIGANEHTSGIYNIADSASAWIAETSYEVGDLISIEQPFTDGSGESRTRTVIYRCKTANSDSDFTVSKWEEYGQYLFVIGNGTSNNARSNAASIDWDGNERLKGDLYVGCNADGSGGAKAATLTDISGKADKTDTVLLTTLSLGRKENTTVGSNSTALGNIVEASGAYSHAEGCQTTASGTYGSHAEGSGTTASGVTSHAEGILTTASGTYAHAEGSGTTASGDNGSHAEGNYTTASGGAAHAEGNSSKATADNAHAEGNNSRAVATNSHAEGYNTYAAGNSSHAEGTGYSSSSTEYGALGKADHAEGYCTKANSGSNPSYYGAHAEGKYTEATSRAAHAEGNYSKASGLDAHAEGDHTTASAQGAHAEGTYTTASSVASHAEGNYARAVGYQSHAEGYNTYAAGNSSHAEGTGYSSSSTMYGALGKADHAEGYQTTANSGSNSSSYGAHAEGALTTATGHGAHAEGVSAKATGSAAHAEGYGTTASGTNSHAEGYYAKATAQYSHAEGYYTTASGINSHAEGNFSVAQGYCSHAEGHYAVADGATYQMGQHVFGGYNYPIASHSETITAEGATTWEPYKAYKAYSCYFPDTINNTGAYYVPHGEIPAYIDPTLDYMHQYWSIYNVDGSTLGTIPEWDKDSLYPVNSVVKVLLHDGTYQTFKSNVAIETTYFPLGSSYYYHTQQAGSTIQQYPYVIEIVGNGFSSNKWERSNARTLDYEGNERLMGDLYVHCDKCSEGGTKVATVNEVDPLSDWLEHNNLDATVTGKINMLSTPYTIDDIATGKIIYSNGSINDAANSCVSPLIPISAGIYGLKTAHNEYIGNINDGNSYKNGYGFFAADGTTVVSRPTNLLHSLGNDIFVFEAPADAAYVRFSYFASSASYYDSALNFFNQWILLPDANDNITSSFFVVQVPKPNIEIDKLLRIDGSYASLRDTSAREDAAEALARPITFGRKTCAIFEKVCCIGDSYTEGYIYSSAGVAHSNNQYSWVEHIKNATGRDYVNCGVSGATTKTWLTSERGLAKAQLPENKAQAYIVALQINDAETSLDIGTIADVGTSAQTYYGCTSKIIDEIFTINNDAHIFFLTQPKHYTGIHSPYRTAELAVIEWYQTTGNGTHQNQVHLIDLLDYWELFQNPGCTDSSANGHYTGVGWEYTAEIIMYAWSEYINAHPMTFQDVNLIPFSASPKVTDMIQKPISANAGDFLCYNGTSWVATTLSTWNGGNY